VYLLYFTLPTGLIMDNKTNPDHPEPQVYYDDAGRPATPPKKWRPSIFVIVLVSLCCLSAVVFSIYSYLYIQPDNAADQAAIEKLVDQFMRDMAARDTVNAYALFTSAARRTIPLSDLEKLLEENDQVLYFGYQKVEITSLEVSSGLDISPSAVENRIAKVKGKVYYEGGSVGLLDAVFMRENHTWRIHNLNLNIPSLAGTPTPQVVSTRLTALAIGVLTLQDGCLRLDPVDDATDSYLLVWPPDITPTIQGDTVKVIDSLLHLTYTWRIGDQLQLGGGELSSIPESLRSVQPKICQGPYWIVGGVLSPTPPPE
jgi:hypothetical protein